jgi:cell wall-associated NlpC family hydrolase
MADEHPAAHVDAAAFRTAPMPGRAIRRAVVPMALALAALPLAATSSAQAAAGGGAPLTGAPATPTPTTRTHAPRNRQIVRFVAAARTRIGSVYETGATGPDAFDCSGLVTWAAERVGIHVPRVSFDQYRTGRYVDRGHIRAGDLVFFDTDGPGASDVGIATGPRTEISATVHGGVMVHPIFDAYWGSHFVGARRLR